MALPYIYLYVGDIKKDTDLLSPAAFGGYVRLLFKMHEATNRGEVSFTLPQLNRVFGAGTIEETISILTEIVDPSYNICTYTVQGEKHLFINRRMKKEAALSETRSKAGKKGAEKTNSKFRQSEPDAEDFAAANSAAEETANNTACSSSNETANTQENYNTNINNNSSNNEFKGGAGGNYSDTRVLLVPELSAIWKALPEKKDYILSKEADYPALLRIGENIAELLNLTDFTGVQAIDEIKRTFLLIVNFMVKDPLYKDFQLSQFAKYFNAITSKMKTQHQERKNAATANGRTSIIENNINAAAGAREILAKKYGS